MADDGRRLQRTITVQGAPANLYARLAHSAKIEPAGNGLYLIDDKGYYLRIDDAGGGAAAIRNSTNSSGGMELLIPVQSGIKYSIIY